MANNVKKDGVTVVTLKEENVSGCKYSLYCFSIGESEKYIISSISDRDNDIQMVGGTEEQAVKLFECICYNQLSCDHLADIANDYNKQLQYNCL